MLVDLGGVRANMSTFWLAQMGGEVWLFAGAEAGAWVAPPAPTRRWH